jgi:hypothetical protein
MENTLNLIYNMAKSASKGITSKKGKSRKSVLKFIKRMNENNRIIKMINEGKL